MTTERSFIGVHTPKLAKEHALTKRVSGKFQEVKVRSFIGFAEFFSIIKGHEDRVFGTCMLFDHT